MTAEQKTAEEEAKKEFEIHIESEVKRYYPIDEVHKSDMQYARSAAFWNGARASYPFFVQKTATLQKQLEELLGVDQPYSLSDTLEYLVLAADILLHKDYDGGNHKEILTASKRGKEIITLLSRTSPAEGGKG